MIIRLCYFIITFETVIIKVNNFKRGDAIMYLIIANFFATRWYTFFLAFCYIFLMFVVTHKLRFRWAWRWYTILEQVCFMSYFIFELGRLMTIQNLTKSVAIYRLAYIVQLSWLLISVPFFVILLYRIFTHEYFKTLNTFSKVFLACALLIISGVSVYLGALASSMLYFSI